MLRRAAKQIYMVAKEAQDRALAKAREDDYEYMIDTLSSITGLSRDSVIATATETDRLGIWEIEGAYFRVQRVEQINYAMMFDDKDEKAHYRQLMGCLLCSRCRGIYSNQLINEVTDLNTFFDRSDQHEICGPCSRLEAQERIDKAAREKEMKSVFGRLFGGK